MHNSQKKTERIWYWTRWTLNMNGKNHLRVTCVLCYLINYVKITAYSEHICPDIRSLQALDYLQRIAHGTESNDRENEQSESDRESGMDRIREHENLLDASNRKDRYVSDSKSKSKLMYYVEAALQYRNCLPKLNYTTTIGIIGWVSPTSFPLDFSPFLLWRNMIEAQRQSKIAK